MLRNYVAASAMVLALSSPAFAQMNDFRMESMQSNAFEVQSAQIALQKSRNGRVRSYAQEALRDHRAANVALAGKAESALRQSEERFAKAFRLTPVPTVLVRANDLHVTSINEAFSRVFGHGEDRILGRPLTEAGLWVNETQRVNFEMALERQGYVLGVEVCLRHETGQNLDCLVSAERVEINDTTFVLLVMQDITDRKHTERELFEAIETVMADTSWFSRGLIEKLANLRRPSRQDFDPSVPELTTRERQILNLICSGLDDGAIARKLGLSRNTVRNHGAALYRKLGVHKRTEAVVWGRENGFPVHLSGT